MREIVLDTETTGLDPAKGDRIVEIGAVELINRMPTGKTWHRYLNPDRDMPKESEAIHGLSSAFLADKPRFAAEAASFLEFVGDATLVIHNAPFDMGFINSELAYCDMMAIPMARVIDTVMMARRTHPMGPNNLDALCKRYGVDNSKRVKHGALLDAELLAEVYLEMTGGKQTTLGLATASGRSSKGAKILSINSPTQRPRPLPPRLTETEREAHEQAVAKLGDKAIWKG